jgi:hypothetical protein
VQIVICIPLFIELSSAFMYDSHKAILGIFLLKYEKQKMLFEQLKTSNLAPDGFKIM